MRSALALLLFLSAPAARADEHHAEDRRALAAQAVGNVHQQVAAARREFHTEVKSGKLHVVGAVYDFRNDLGHGTGRLVVVDVDPELMREAEKHMHARP